MGGSHCGCGVAEDGTNERPTPLTCGRASKDEARSLPRPVLPCLFLLVRVKSPRRVAVATNVCPAPSVPMMNDRDDLY